MKTFYKITSMKPEQYCSEEEKLPGITLVVKEMVMISTICSLN
jgi:hypothetical protein